ncbi:MAG: thiamine pyrophosphate-dependent dehydrogenase E1 component subunit alpha [Anaerolineaceae bacterium]|nr:MAG: thiamine pyrophosphate-dependent dehydrogenase E1 component subunit alpha [Anaerolineaceae bacterium]
MEPDLWYLYRHMFRSRLFEQVVQVFWEQGLISFDMHMGYGEEAIAAGIVCQMVDGDAMALDHRGTPPLLMRGIEPTLILRELMGRPDGLCGGLGGHMHLYSREHLCASSGIVGSSGPAGAGFALAAQYLRPGTLAIAFFGEGAINQGMLLESMNLAVAWQLPLLFVCKDDKWSISTRSASVTGGELVERARGFGLHTVEVDGADVEAVWHSAGEAMKRTRDGGGPTFLHAHCVHLEGHHLGFFLFRVGRDQIKEMIPLLGPLLRSATRRKGGSSRERIRSLTDIATRPRDAVKEQTQKEKDPLYRTRQKLISDRDRLEALEAEINVEIQDVMEVALED